MKPPKKTERRKAREAALQLLYQLDINPPELPLEPDQCIALLQEHFDHFQVLPHLREFSAQLVSGVLMQRDSLDERIQRLATQWKLGRMGTVERNLLRMASFELISCADIPAAITIDEAIEISKTFGSADTAGFINGILEAVRSEIQKSDLK